MDFKTMNTKALSMLWQASEGNLALRATVENELQSRAANSNQFSREFFFQLCLIKGHAATISFIPSSSSYKKYGDNVTITVILDDKEMEEMILNHRESPPKNTQGILRAKALVERGLTHEQIDKLAKEGFNTKDVLDVLSV